MSEYGDPPPEPPMAALSAAPRPSVWTRTWLPYPLFVIVGLIAGFAVAVSGVRSGGLDSGDRIGAWETGRNFATGAQSARLRARIAVSGLLALPAAEARYYNARVDDAGQPLTANCTYRLTGGRLAAQFWTMTLYDDDGYLIPNDANLYSAGNMTMAPTEQVRWTILVSPVQQPGRWLPTGGGTGRIQLTLRAYLPADGGKGNFPVTELPTVRKESCR